MKTPRLHLLLLVVATAMLPQTASATQRVALLETFTNTGCVTCPEANAATHDFAFFYGPTVVLNVQYHLSGPSITDPFYQADIVDNDARAAYYGILAAPDLITDGVNTPEPGDYDVLQHAIGDVLIDPSPFEITVSTSTGGGNITINASVTATADVPASGLTLHMALVEPYVNTDPPGNDNGERDFYCTMRKMLPSASGQTLTISNGQTLPFSQMTALNPSWQDIYAVVWVQNETDKSVMQAASSLPPPNYAYFYGAETTFAMVPFDLYTFNSTLSNRGSQNDNYDVHVDWDVPAGWGGGFCEGSTCHNIGDNDFSTDRISAGEEALFTVDFSPFGDFGEGSCTVTMTSQGLPLLTWSETFKVVTYGVPILLVDDDGGTNYETYFENALLADDQLFATWNLDTNGKLSAPEMSNFHIVIWEVGEHQPSVDATDRAALAAYLDGGGDLFITGQDIGYDIFSPSGTQYGPDAQNWYHNYLGADFIMDDTNLLSITGVPGDPIGDGLTFDISGGSGANNQLYPSEIEPTQGGVGCLTYATDREAAVHKDNGTFKTVYFAFGFEGIAEAAERVVVMDRILNWMDIDIVGVPQGSAPTPYLVSLPTVSPNPFNPTAQIDFEISGQGATPLDVSVFDLRGQKIRTVWQGPVLPGAQHFLWDGLTDAGGRAASGIYLAHVKLPGQDRTIKMTLAK